MRVAGACIALHCTAQEKQILLEDQGEQLNLLRNTAAYGKLPAVGASRIPVAQQQQQSRSALGALRQRVPPSAWQPPRWSARRHRPSAHWPTGHWGSDSIRFRFDSCTCSHSPLPSARRLVGRESGGVSERERRGGGRAARAAHSGQIARTRALASRRYSSFIFVF